MIVVSARMQRKHSYGLTTCSWPFSFFSFNEPAVRFASQDHVGFPTSGFKTLLLGANADR